MPLLQVTKVGEPKPKETKFGPLFSFMVSGTIDDQPEMGMMSVKDMKNAPAVGQALEVEVTTNDYGTLFKRVQAFPPTNGTKALLPKGDESAKYPSFALAYAKDIIVAKLQGAADADERALIETEWLPTADLALAWLRQHSID